MNEEQLGLPVTADGQGASTAPPRWLFPGPAQMAALEGAVRDPSAPLSEDTGLSSGPHGKQLNCPLPSGPGPAMFMAFLFLQPPSAALQCTQV